jgi:hypothetical protein
MRRCERGGNLNCNIQRFAERQSVIVHPLTQRQPLNVFLRNEGSAVFCFADFVNHTDIRVV